MGFISSDAAVHTGLLLLLELRWGSFSVQNMDKNETYSCRKCLKTSFHADHEMSGI